MVAAPRFVRRNAMKCDAVHRQSAQHFSHFGFMRAVTNIDANLFRFDKRFDQRAQGRQDAIE